MLGQPQPAPQSSAPPISVPVERAAWAFYTVAALGSSIGQIWVGVEIPPWPSQLPMWTRALCVLPFALVIDLGGAVTAAFADTRRRLGESAYGWRVLSAASVAVGVGINIIGHAKVPYLAVVFGGLGVFAYCVWLLHSSARRRDALRAAGKLHRTPPVYGLLQWWREPALTRRARALALQHDLGLVESLAAARDQIAAERRRAALASHIDAKIRSRHADPVLAAIAATTTRVDDVAQKLIDMSDAQGWALAISSEIHPPTAVPTQPSTTPPDGLDRSDALSDSAEPALDLPPDISKAVPTNPTVVARWRAMWVEISERPHATSKELADELETSVRTVQRIRAVGATGMLERLPS